MLEYDQKVYAKIYGPEVKRKFRFYILDLFSDNIRCIDTSSAAVYRFTKVMPNDFSVNISRTGTYDITPDPEST
eukprot:672892-Pyramimonas_sp.AAC.1